MSELAAIVERDADWDAEFTGADWRAADVLRDRRVLLGLLREGLDVERLAQSLFVLGYVIEPFRLDPPADYELHLQNVAKAIAAEYARQSKSERA